MAKELQTDVAIIGAGSAGLYALREVRRAHQDFVLIDCGPLGTTCARVGCMPSKVALHAGAQWAARKDFAAIGVSGMEQLRIDLRLTWEALRRHRDRFTASAADKARSTAGEKLLDGRARFLEPTLLEVACPGGATLVRARSVVIASGSRPVMPDWLEPVRSRTISTDALYELDILPASIGILGLGAIGLEMGLALARLGVRVVGADLASTVGGIIDPVIAERAFERFGKELPLWLGEKTSVEPHGNGVMLRAGDREAKVEMLLAALGRRPNVDGLNLAAAGFALDEQGIPAFDPETMQIGDLPVFIAGDANSDRPLMHEAADEGSIAGYNAAHGISGTPVRFQRKVPLAIAFCDPDVASVGARLDTLDADSIIIGNADGGDNGRAVILDGAESLLRLYADASTGQLLGGAMVAAGGEHLAHLLAWAIQRRETAASLLQLPFYHPVLEEMLQTALQEIVRQSECKSPYPFGLTPVADA
ncbi:dihydrolipoyl dehydrogenase [Janthinobacterium sp. 17J80-10]|uniref:dihydrolipoyl dehydrogenase n=1 Tax=Janthinobacterium sp. 17J80-10 TaxID=2497863 RepID=UPI00100540F7|nr:dihydrolipoyl dehydrogenase [Janthinobacterium sp. 17J80-10]QAU34515.1 dihydrolipoyl dehydrogenase [Janthinobacterium sp. 17J80-10]